MYLENISRSEHQTCQSRLHLTALYVALHLLMPCCDPGRAPTSLNVDSDDGGALLRTQQLRFAALCTPDAHRRKSYRPNAYSRSFDQRLGNKSLRLARRSGYFRRKTLFVIPCSPTKTGFRSTARLAHVKQHCCCDGRSLMASLFAPEASVLDPVTIST